MMKIMPSKPFDMRLVLKMQNRRQRYGINVLGRLEIHKLEKKRRENTHKTKSDYDFYSSRPRHSN